MWFFNLKRNEASLCIFNVEFDTDGEVAASNLRTQ
jgi:hypothetical protein